MRLVLHLLRKDIRAAWWPWLIWTALVSLDVALQALSAAAVMDPIQAFEELGPAPFGLVMPFSQIGVVLLLVSRIVHSDPLVDANAFWLTRPIPPRRLFASKLLAIALLIVGPPIVLHGIALLAFEVPPAYVARMGVEIVYDLAIPLALVGAAAAITPDGRLFMVLLATTCLGLILGSVALSAWPQSAMRMVVTAEPGFADPTRPLCVTVFFVGAVILIVRRHYVRRDWQAAAASAILAVAGAVALSSLWPPDASLFAAHRAPDAAWAQPSITSLRRDGDRMRITGPGVRRQQVVAAPLVLDGLPDDYTAAPFTLRARLTYADGAIADSGRTPLVQMPAGAAYRPSLTLAYGPAPLAAGPTEWEGWPTLIEMPAAILGDRIGKPARYEGTFRYRLARHERLATLPLRLGVTHVDGPRRLAIADVATVRGRCGVALELTDPVLDLNGPREPALGYHFVDRHTGARLRHVRDPQNAPDHWYPRNRTGIARLFTVRYVTFAIEDLASRERPPYERIPRACEDTSLVVARSTPDGALTRTITLPALRIGPEGQDFPSR